MLLRFLPAEDCNYISPFLLRLLSRNFGLGRQRLLLRPLGVNSVALRTEPVPPLFLHPIEVVVVFKATAVEEILEDGAKAVIVRSFLERNLPHLPHIGNKLHRDTFTQLFKCHLTLLPADRFVLCLFVENFHTLPREISTHKVY